MASDESMFPNWDGVEVHSTRIRQRQVDTFEIRRDEVFVRPVFFLLPLPSLAGAFWFSSLPWLKDYTLKEKEGIHELADVQNPHIRTRESRERRNEPQKKTENQTQENAKEHQEM